MGALDPRTALAAVKLVHTAVWLARNNQRLFGALFVLGLAILAWSWLGGGLPPLTPSGPP